MARYIDNPFDNTQPTAPVQTSAPAPVAVPKAAPAPVPAAAPAVANPTVVQPAPVQTTYTPSAAMITGVQPQSPPPPGMVTGGNNPAIPGLPFGSGTPMPKPTYTPQPNTPFTPAYQPGMAPGQVVQDLTNQFLNRENPYISNARLRGVELAQQRGLRNSSIAAGASERAAVEAAQPFIESAIGIQQNREGRAFEGDQAERQRQFTAGQNQLDRDQQVTMAQIQDWMNNNQFQREFNGTLSMIPIQSAQQLNQLIQQYALENPKTYTPDIVSGLTNFFNQNFYNTLRQYFPQYYGR